jgi:hypothetical protein
LTGERGHTISRWGEQPPFYFILYFFYLFFFFWDSIYLNLIDFFIIICQIFFFVFKFCWKFKFNNFFHIRIWQLIVCGLNGCSTLVAIFFAASIRPSSSSNSPVLPCLNTFPLSTHRPLLRYHLPLPKTDLIYS